MSKIGERRGNGPNWDQKLACSENPEQNIWKKIEYSSKSRQEKKVWYLFLRVF